MKSVIDISKHLPYEIFISTGRIYKCEYVINKDNIKALYKTPVKNQFENTNGIRFHKQILPRLFPYNLSWRIFGILKAEMSVGKNNGKIQFANSEPEIIRTVVKWFEKFGIFSKDWSWRITFNKKFKLNESEKESIARELAAKDFWIKEVGLSANKLNRKWVRYGGTEKGKMKDDRPFWGTVIIEAGNTALRAIIVGLIKEISRKIVRNSANEVELFLDGFFSGEACFHKGKREIIIPIKDEEERKRIKFVMKKLEFTIDNDMNCREVKAIKTGGVKDIFIAYKTGLFKMNPLRRAKLLENLLNIQRFFSDAKPLKEELKNTLPKIEYEYKILQKFLEQRKEKFELLKQNYL